MMAKFTVFFSTFSVFLYIPPAKGVPVRPEASGSIRFLYRQATIPPNNIGVFSIYKKALGFALGSF